MTDDARKVVVASKTAAAEGVVALTLYAADGGALPTWLPGAHVDLVLGPGLVRQYSLCGDPGERGSYRVAVLREPTGRGGSAHVHDRIGAGDTLTLHGPRNHFPLADADSYLFVAGGIGITPLLPMVAHVAASGRPWSLLYGGRTRAGMAFLAELAALGPVTVVPQDECGLLDLEAAVRAVRPGMHVYCCGPEPLLHAMEQLHDAGWAAGPLHVERFAPRPSTSASDGPVTGFEVECASSGLVVQVDPDTSILHALEAAGLTILSSCREGTCGTCETGVVSGDPDHRDSVLTAEERRAGEVMMICCSRSRSPRLVLDL